MLLPAQYAWFEPVLIATIVVFISLRAFVTGCFAWLNAGPYLFTSVSLSIWPGQAASSGRLGLIGVYARESFARRMSGDYAAIGACTATRPWLSG